MKTENIKEKERDSEIDTEIKIDDKINYTDLYNTSASTNPQMAELEGKEIGVNTLGPMKKDFKC